MNHITNKKPRRLNHITKKKLINISRIITLKEMMMMKKTQMIPRKKRRQPMELEELVAAVLLLPNLNQICQTH